MASDGSDKEKKISQSSSFSERSASCQQTGSSVWNLCDTQAVDLRDITPSISPVFTEDQVRELSGQTSDLDGLGDNFLPHIKRITEVLSPEQTNLIISTCTSLCSESDGLSYTDPVVGSIGHFASQHVPVLNSPPDKNTTTNNATANTTKSEEAEQPEPKHLLKSTKDLETGSTECGDECNTDSKIDAQDLKDNTSEELVPTTKENKSNNKKVKSSYTLRSSPRKAAREDKSPAESPSKNTRQKTKKDPVEDIKRRKSPRGQKQTLEKDETQTESEQKGPARKGKQKDQKQTETNIEEEIKKDEGTNLRRSSRIQKHDISPVKPKTQSPRKGRAARKKIPAEDSDTKTDQKETQSEVEEKLEAKAETICELKEENKETSIEIEVKEEMLETKDVSTKSETHKDEQNKDDIQLESNEESKQPTSFAFKREQEITTKEDNLLKNDPVVEEKVADNPSREAFVDSNPVPTGDKPVGVKLPPRGVTVDTSSVPTEVGTVNTKNYLVPTGVGTNDTNLVPIGLGTVDTNIVPTGVTTVDTNFIPSELGTVTANIIPTGVGTEGSNVVPTGVGSGLIPIGLGTVSDNLIPTREGILGSDVLTVEKDILEIIEKEINLPTKGRLHFHPDSVNIFEKKEDLAQQEEKYDDNQTKPVEEVKKSDAEESKTEDEMKKTEVKQTKRRKKEVQPSRRSNRISESIQKKEIEAAVKKAQEEMFREREEQERLEREEEERKRKEEEETNKKEEETVEKEDEKEKECKDIKEKESPKRKAFKKKEKTQESKPKDTKKSKDQDEKPVETKSKEHPDTTQRDKNKNTVAKKQPTEKTEEQKKTKSESEGSTLFAVGGDQEVYSTVKHKRLSTEHDTSKDKEEKQDKLSSSEDERDSNDEAIDEDDSDYDPEYDPERLWCICRKPHGNRFMICCDSCEEWLHGDCVSITKEIGKEMEKNGIEYICPRCVIAKKKLREQGIDPNKDKQSDETTPRRRRRRRLKIPGEKHHRRSADSTTKSGKSKREGHVKKPKEEKEEKSSESKRKIIDPSSFYKIPKKVRTTPTPASFSSRAQRKCINSGCDNTAETHSVYCSDKCITKHAQEAINLLHEERKKRAVSSHKPAPSHTSGINVPMPWESQQMKTPTSPQVKERVAVIERSTGRVIAGVAAPAEHDLVTWLHRHPTFEVIKPSVSKEVRKKDKKEEEKAIRDNVKRTLKDILSSRLKEAPELKLSPEDISKFSVNIEEDLYKLFGEAGPRYKSKYRSLAFNLKDFRNKVLFHHVLSGEVPTDRLVGMTAEQLASQELARWRERETKHTIEMIKQNQLDINASKGHIKKTHKGEIELDEDEDLSSLEARTPSKEKENSQVAEPDSNTSPGPLLIDTTDQHRIHLFDLNCRICTGKMQPPGEPPRQEDMLMLVSTTTPIQALAESSIPSPPPVSADIASVSSTESFDVGSVSPPAPAKPVKRDKPVWKGYVMMQSVAKFSTNAYRVSGPCDDLLHLLPDTLHLQGRIGFKQVWGYIEQLRHSTTRDVSIVRYEVSSDDEKTSYVSLYSYFYSRKRCGVVSNCYTGVKDMYLVPLASHAPIPSELLPFDGPGLEEPRPHMLIGVIVRTKAHFKRPRPVHHRSGSSPTPKRRHGSSKSTEEVHPKDSPPRVIEDIVFYNKKASVETKPTVSPSSGSSEHSSTISSPTAAASNVAETSAEKKQQSNKEELQDLADRAKQYIASALKAKQQSQQKDDEVKPDDETKPDDEDKPYDPEEDFDLDLELEKPIDDKKPTKIALKSTDVSSTEETSSAKTENKSTDKEMTDITAKTNTIGLSLDAVSSSTPSITVPPVPASLFMPISSSVSIATSSSSSQPLATSSQLPMLSIPSTDLAGIVKLLQRANTTKPVITTPTTSQIDSNKLTTAATGAATTLTRDTRQDHRGATAVYRRPSVDERGGRPTEHSRHSGSTTETDRQRIDRERLEWRERRQSKEGPRDHGAPRDDNRWRGPRDSRDPPPRRVSDERYQGDYRGPHPGRGRHQPYHRDDRRGDRRGDRRDDNRWKERWRR